MNEGHEVQCGGYVGFDLVLKQSERKLLKEGKS